MGKLRELITRLGSVNQETILQEALNSVKRHEKEATNLNTDQLYEGKDAKGKNLPNYSEKSVKVFGKRPGPWKLFDQGDFYRGFFVRIESGRVLFDSKDSKTGMILQLLEGKGHNEPLNIFGLQPANRKELAIHYVLPDVQGFVWKAIKGR